MTEIDLMDASGDTTLRQWLTQEEHPPLASVADSRPNWKTCREFENLTQALKTVAERGTDSHLRSTILWYAGELVVNAYMYNYDMTRADFWEQYSKEQIWTETVGTASGTLVPTFLRGAVSEIHAGTDVPGEVVREAEDDAPTPEGGKDWETAGWDIVVVHPDGSYTTYQVKATARPPGPNADKQADKVYWLPCVQGEFKFDRAGVM